MSTEIRSFDNNDWEEVAGIYKQGLDTRNATFETQVPDYETWINKFHRHLLWVAVINN